MFFDQPERLAEFHDENGHERETEADEVRPTGQIRHAESGVHAGHEHHERDHREGYQRREIEHLIAE